MSTEKKVIQGGGDALTSGLIKADTYKSPSTDLAASSGSGGFKPSTQLQEYQSSVKALETQGAPQYDDGGKQAVVDKVLSDIQNRAPYEYDFNTDPLFRQYKDSYTRMGQQAMRDTTARAAAMTGGYGNSYAETAGQQSYNDYMQKLNDIIPELDDRAYGRWKDEDARLFDLYGVASGEEEKAYGRYRDDVGDYLTDRDYYNGRADALYSQEYGAYDSDRTYGLNAAQLEETKAQNAIANGYAEREMALKEAAAVASAAGSSTEASPTIEDYKWLSNTENLVTDAMGKISDYYEALKSIDKINDSKGYYKAAEKLITYVDEMTFLDEESLKKAGVASSYAAAADEAMKRLGITDAEYNKIHDDYRQNVTLKGVKWKPAGR